MSSLPPASCSSRWSASVAGRFLHQWQTGFSRSSSVRARRYAVLDVRVGIAHALASLGCASALALLGCWRVALAERADGLSVDDCVSELFRKVCFAALRAVADVDDRCVGELDFHVAAVVMLLGQTAPGRHPTVV